MDDIIRAVRERYWKELKTEDELRAAHAALDNSLSPLFVNFVRKGGTDYSPEARVFCLMVDEDRPLSSCLVSNNKVVIAADYLNLSPWTYNREDYDLLMETIGAHYEPINTFPFCKQPSLKQELDHAPGIQP